MVGLGTYEIQFSGLSEGEHEFQFEADHKFFDCFEESEITTGNVQVKLLLLKKVQMLELQFKLSGSVEVQCDRCLEALEVPISNTSMLYVKFGETTEELAEDLIVLSDKAHKINIAQYIYEFIQLSLPYKKVHPKDPSGKSYCNPEMLNRLIKFSANHPEDDIDPRWKELKEVLNKKK